MTLDADTLKTHMNTLRVDHGADEASPEFQKCARRYLEHVKDTFGLMNIELEEILDRGKTTIHRYLNSTQNIPRGAIDTLTRYHIARLDDAPTLRRMIRESFEDVTGDGATFPELPFDLVQLLYYRSKRDPRYPESTTTR